MPRKWKSLEKVSEECGELIVELMKLKAFPDGKHPGRKRSLVTSVEEECADVLAAIKYFVDKNKLNKELIEKRASTKRKKYEKWWGEVDPKRASPKKANGHKSKGIKSVP